MPVIPIKFGSAPVFTYDVVIQAGLLDQLGPRVREAAPAPGCGVVSDQTVAAHYLDRARRSLRQAGYRVSEFVFPAGEQQKNLATVHGAYDVFLADRLERTSPLVALGGGVVGDLAGFVAATLLRGVPLIQAPTTLLSAVDAGIGGKVGVDHPLGKNLIGAFHQPRAVLTDVDALATLPDVELQCGLAECVKHAMIRDADLFAFIESRLPEILRRNPAALSDLIAGNVRIKADLVMEDPFEHGPRALLNFGHTFGHALETVTRYTSLRHGQAVALGMIAAARLAVSRRLLVPADAARLETLLVRIGLPVRLDALDIDSTLVAMRADKKVRSGRLRFVLPSAIGAAQIFMDVTESEIRAALTVLISPREACV